MIRHSTSGFSNYSAFFRALVILYIVLMGGLIALRILFNHHSNALNRDFALANETRNIIEGIDTMYLLSKNLIGESRNYTFTEDSNTYYVNISVRDSL